MSRTARTTAIALILCVFSSACAIAPLTRKFGKWSAESCGRGTFLDRLCSGLVMIVTSPVYIVTLLVDWPVSMIEFFGGTQLIEDPLVRTAQLDFEKKTFAGNAEGEQWEAARMVEEPEYFAVTKTLNGMEVASYRVRPLPDGQLEVAELEKAED